MSRSEQVGLRLAQEDLQRIPILGFTHNCHLLTASQGRPAYSGPCQRFVIGDKYSQVRHVVTHPREDDNNSDRRARVVAPTFSFASADPVAWAAREARNIVESPITNWSAWPGSVNAVAEMARSASRTNPWSICRERSSRATSTVSTCRAIRPAPSADAPRASATH